jgi:hypothetical protein
MAAARTSGARVRPLPLRKHLRPRVRPRLTGAMDHTTAGDVNEALTMLRDARAGQFGF